jgi:Putative abortive phage resistance protein AbiGi, antitoxin
LYVSTELTHFVGSRLRPDRAKQFELLIKIIEPGVLSSYPAAPSNWGNIAFGRPLTFTDGEFFGLAKACFCDTPFADLAIHAGKYGEFGLAFPKAFLVQQGASPAFYVAANALLDSTPLGDHLKQNLDNLMSFFDLRNGLPENIRGPLSYFLVTRLAGYVKAFDASRPDDDNFN